MNRLAFTAALAVLVRRAYGQVGGRGTHPSLDNLTPSAPGIQYFDSLGKAHALTLDQSLVLDTGAWTLRAITTPVKPPVVEYTILAAGQVSFTTTQAINPAWPVKVYLGGWLMKPQDATSGGDYSLVVNGAATINVNTSNQVVYPGLVVAVEYTPL